MGNFPESNKKFLSDWVQVQKEGSPGTFTNVWVQKKDNGKIQMIQYPLHVSSEQDIKLEREIFSKRMNHPQLVSSLYFVDETKNEFCASNYQGDIFIEKIPLTLQTVTDIPFPDALHVYSQSLIGFNILTSEIVRYNFPISEEHIGISCESICKVWMNDKYDRNVPTRNEHINEHVMVRMILDTIEGNVDLSSLQGIPSPIHFIYSRSRSPTQVRFDEAINLFQIYVNEFFGGVVPLKMACVDKVGGIFALSKNWKNLYESAQMARNQSSQILFQNERRSSQNISHPPTSKVITPIPQNNYTTFRRQEPVFQHPAPQPMSIQTSMAHGLINQNQIQRSTTPSFGQGPEENVFTRSKVQVPVPNQQSRVVQQIVYQGSNTVPPQIVGIYPQQQTKTFAGSFVQPPVVFNAVNPQSNPQSNQFKESLIQNRVTNGQIIPCQPVSIQQAPQSFVIQQGPLQQIPQTVHQFPQPQQVIHQQVPKVVFVKQVPQTQPSYVQGIHINGLPQQLVVQNQQIQPPFFSSQVCVSPIQRIFQPANIVRRSQISFGSPVASLPQGISTPYQVGKTTSVYVTPLVLNRAQIDQNDVQRNSPSKNQINQANGVDLGLDQRNLRLRDNQESISSINAQTNPVQSNEQLSDKFSMLKEEPVDTSTRNFYTNMMNNNELTSKTGNDYFSSYYANYTSKLYDNGDAVEQVQASSNHYISSRSKVEASESPQVGGKYNVTRDDGMSSPDFLSQLKNIKPTTSPFVKAQSNYDYGFTTYDTKNEANRYSNSSDQQAYKFDFKNYATTLPDGNNNQNDLNVVGSNVDILPSQSSRANPVIQNPYKISYEYEEAENPNGNLAYQSQHFQVNAGDGSYEEQYYQTTNYQSTFDKYASYDKYVQPEESVNQNDYRLGENLQTQFSRNNAEEAQNFEITRNTANTTYNAYSPMHQRSEEEYQVEYDPEILADLQKLKGVN